MFGFREDFDENNRIVKQENVEYKGKIYWISTVDLGLNYSFLGDKPLWYETMVFLRKENGDIDFYDLYCDRYTTREEALEGHEKAKGRLANGLIGIK